MVLLVVLVILLIVLFKGHFVNFIPDWDIISSPLSSAYFAASVFVPSELLFLLFLFNWILFFSGFLVLIFDSSFLVSQKILYNNLVSFVHGASCLLCQKLLPGLFPNICLCYCCISAVRILFMDFFILLLFFFLCIHVYSVYFFSMYSCLLCQKAFCGLSKLFFFLFISRAFYCFCFSSQSQKALPIRLRKEITRCMFKYALIM